jgi:putative ABC transport system substrate-binding protein
LYAQGKIAMINKNLLARFVPLFLLVAAVLILSGCNAEAAPKIYRVGVLSGVEFFATTVDGFKAKMTELGYVESQNIVYDIQKTSFDPAKYQQILKKFVADEVDLIFVFPTEASVEAKMATQGTNIPVVFANASVEGVGLIESVRQPGGNITGVRYPGPDLTAKRLEILNQLVPQAKRILIPYQQGYPIVPPQLEVLYPVASSIGITLVEAPVSNAAELQAELQARTALDDIGIDAILIIDEPLGANPEGFAVLSEFAAEHKILIGGHLQSAGGYGSVFGVRTDNIAVGTQAALLTDKIFKGIPAGTIPVVSADSILQIDYKQAQELGLTVPEGLLSQADEIIR